MDRAFPLPEPAGGARGPRPTAAASAGTAEGHVGAGDAPPEIPGTRSAPPAAASAAPAAPEAASSGARDGDRLLLFEPATGHRFLLHADGRGARKERGLGVVDPARFVGHAWGTGHRVGQKDVVLLRPRLEDLASTIARKAAIILPKDASRIVYELGAGAGMRVFESGVGSGAATIALAWAVGGAGKVVVQELREDFRDWALDNLRRAGLADRVEVHLGDANAGLAPAARGPFDAALLDLPEPWAILPSLVPELAPGASVACYTPQVSQMEAAHRTLLALGFAAVRSLELIERGWEVKERGSRPGFEGLGHTAFLTFGRWLGTPVPADAAPAGGRQGTHAAGAHAPAAAPEPNQAVQ